jgi:hypothetical protein
MIKSSHSDSIRAREKYRDSASEMSLRMGVFAKCLQRSGAFYQRFGAILQHFGKIVSPCRSKISRRRIVAAPVRTAAIRQALLHRGQTAPPRPRYRKAKREHFGHGRANLPRRKIDNGGDLPPDQLVADVIGGDLRAAFFLANDRAKVDPQPVARLARLREFLSRHDSPDADINLEEILEGDLGSRWRIRIMADVHYGTAARRKLANCRTARAPR